MEASAPAAPAEIARAEHPLALIRDRALALLSDAQAAHVHLVDVHQAGREDAEAIHDFRVALRRLRSAMRPLGIAWGKKKTTALAERLRALVDPTGELRDEEVLRETLADLDLKPHAREALTKWQVGRARRERGLRSRVMGTLLAADDFSRVMEDIAELVASAPKHAMAPEALAREALSRALHKLRERAYVAEASDKLAMHKVRIAAKQLRYTAELFEGVGEIELGRITKSGAKLQKRLGTLHDLDEATLRMGRAYGLAKPAREDVLAAIRHERGRIEKKCEAEIPHELKALAHTMDGAPAVNGP